MLVTQFETLKDYYAWWKTVPHMGLYSRDFLLHHLTVSLLKNEAPNQTLARLERAFQPIHSYDKWKTSGRTTYDTLARELYLVTRGIIPAPDNPYKNWQVPTVFEKVLMIQPFEQYIVKMGTENKIHWYCLRDDVRTRILTVKDLINQVTLTPPSEVETAA